jgi:hypothetical protein
MKVSLKDVSNASYRYVTDHWLPPESQAIIECVLVPGTRS